MDRSRCSGFGSPGYLLAAVVSVGTLLSSDARAAAAASPAIGSSNADQIQPEPRIKRLGQIYEEMHELLADYRTAESNLKELQPAQVQAAAVYASTNQQLQVVVQNQAKLRSSLASTPPGAVVGGTDGPPLTTAIGQQLAQLNGREAGLRQQTYAAQQVIARWMAAKERLARLSQAVQTDLPTKREEWLWLCDPFGKLGAAVHRDSIDTFAKQIDRDREFALSYLARGFSHFHCGRNPEAMRDFFKAALLDKALADVAAVAQGWSYARAQRDSEASSQFATALRLNSSSAFVEMVLAHAYAEREKDNFAEEHFRKAVNLHDELPQAHEALARFLATRRQDDRISVKQAIQEATKACEQTGWSQWLYLDTLAMTCAASGDYPLACKWQAKAVERAPSEFQAELQTRRDAYMRHEASPPDSVSAAATLQSPGGNTSPETRSDAILDAQQGVPRPKLPRPLLAGPDDEFRYVGAIQELLNRGLGQKSARLDAVRPCYEKAIQLCPDDARLYHAWGLVCLKSGDLAAAEQQFQLAADLAEGCYLPAWHALSRTRLLQGKSDLARQSLVRAARALERPENRDLAAEQRRQYEGRLDRAIRFVDQSAEPETDSERTPAVNLDPSHRSAEQDENRQGVSRRTDHESLIEERRTQVQEERLKAREDAEKLLQAQNDKLRQLQDGRNALEFRYAQLQAQAQSLLQKAERTGFLPSQYDRIAVEMDRIDRQIRLMNRAPAAITADTVRQMQVLSNRTDLLDKRDNALKRAQGIKRQGGKAASRDQPQVTLAVQAAVDSLLPLDYEAESREILASYNAGRSIEEPAKTSSSPDR